MVASRNRSRDFTEDGDALVIVVVEVRIKQEIEKLKAMDKALADAPDGQISLTDPDARARATSARNSGLVGYNAQCEHLVDEMRDRPCAATPTR